MAKTGRRLVVDTYAIMADILGQIPGPALEAMEQVRRGRAAGVISSLTVFELAYHWRRGRLPFRDEGELLGFASTYFRVVEVGPRLAAAAAAIKVEGDELLRGSGEASLRGRRLSVADAVVIALAEEYGAPVVTGDGDLGYVARSRGLEVIW